MDILSKLRRAVEDYRKAHKFRPQRICLTEEAIKGMADEIAKRQHNLGTLSKWNERTKDEEFIDGDVFYFKGIPVIAKLAPDNELIVE